jgi:hypothetical protein
MTKVNPRFRNPGTIYESSRRSRAVGFRGRAAMKRFIMFLTALALGSPAWASNNPAYVTQSPYKAACDGKTDDTAAFNSALASNAGGTVYVPNGVSCYLAGPVQIPQQTTLDCLSAKVAQGSASNTFFREPALLLNPGKTATTTSIEAGTATQNGSGATIRNCIIRSSTLTRLGTSEPTWNGIALQDNKWDDFHVQNVTVVGFHTCLWVRGQRPYVEGLYADCSSDGSYLLGANGVPVVGGNEVMAAVQWDVGNSDSGFLINSKIQRIGTGVNCRNGGDLRALRPGAGLSIAGTNIGAAGIWMANVVVQDFAVADYDFRNAAIFGNIWADGLSGGPCTNAVQYNFVIEPGVTVYGGSLNANLANVGIWSINDPNPLSIDKIFVNFSGTTCLLLGNNGHSGTVTGRDIELANCGRNNVVYQYRSGNRLWASQLVLGAIGGRAGIVTTNGAAVTIGPGGGLQFDHLLNNTRRPALAGSGFSMIKGSEREIDAAGIAMSTSRCGTDLVCRIGGPATQHQGIATLTVESGSTASSGSIPLNAAIAGATTNGMYCDVHAFNENGGLKAGWAVTNGGSGRINWSYGSALAAGSYSFAYDCHYW